jgi:hypothetical protein
LNLKVYYCVHKSLPLVPILRQIHPVHKFLPSFPKIHSNIILPSRLGLASGLLPSCFPTRICYSFLIWLTGSMWYTSLSLLNLSASVIVMWSFRTECHGFLKSLQVSVDVVVYIHRYVPSNCWYRKVNKHQHIFTFVCLVMINGHTKLVYTNTHSFHLKSEQVRITDLRCRAPVRVWEVQWMRFLVIFLSLSKWMSG